MVIATKERPIPFSTDNVKAILEGRKTQTRRVIKDPRRFSREREELLSAQPGKPSIGDIEADLKLSRDIKPNFPCPYGQVGDRLWVRETHYNYGHWIKNGKTRTGRQKRLFKEGARRMPSCGYIRFLDNPPIAVCKDKRDSGWFKRSALFMPKRYARTFLEITGVRVERLQEITLGDAQKEGLNPNDPVLAKVQFINLWNSLNAKRGYGWETNPWVWVIEFKKL